MVLVVDVDIADNTVVLGADNCSEPRVGKNIDIFVHICCFHNRPLEIGNSLKFFHVCETFHGVVTTKIISILLKVASVIVIVVVIVTVLEFPRNCLLPCWVSLPVD